MYKLIDEICSKYDDKIEEYKQASVGLEKVLLFGRDSTDLKFEFALNNYIYYEKYDPEKNYETGTYEANYKDYGTYHYKNKFIGYIYLDGKMRLYIAFKIILTSDFFKICKKLDICRCDFCKLKRDSFFLNPSKYFYSPPRDCCCGCIFSKKPSKILIEDALSDIKKIFLTKNDDISFDLH